MAKDSKNDEAWNKQIEYMTNEIRKEENKKNDLQQRIDKAIENAKEKIKRYESYINDLKKGNYPSPTVRQERQELIFRIREQEELLNILKGEIDG